jgi:hypothetical protein
MADPAPPVTFVNTLTNILRFTDNQATTLMNEGYDSADELRFWSADDVKAWAVNKTKLPATRGGCPYGDPRVKSLQAFAFWATDMHRRGLPLDLNTFDAAMLVTYKEMVRVERAKKDIDTKVPLPDVLDNKTDWENWELSLINHLQSKNGIDNIPLSYVIRPDDRLVADETATPEEIRKTDLIYNAPLEGPAFNTDTDVVFAIIESLTIGQDSANWISRRTRRSRNGRDAMNELKQHFDGGEERYKRNQAAVAQLENLQYKHEKMLTFQVFSTKIKKCFDTIELCDQAYSETTKIDTLLRKVKSNNQDLRNVVTIIRSDPVKFDTFMKATQELAKHIAHLFPADLSSGNGQHNRKRGVSGLSNGGPNPNKGYKIVNKNGKQLCSGVDVTDQTRSFSAKEWSKLPWGFKKVLFKNPARKSKKKKGNDDRSVSDTTSSRSLDDESVARVVSGIMRANHSLPQQGPPMPPPPSTIPIQQPRMGAGGIPRSAAALSSNNSGGLSVQSGITQDTRWDHNGNIIE